MYKKIIIFGATGSGKTTLAKQISEILKIPYYSTDDMVYKKVGREKYTQKEIKTNLLNVVRKEKWIIEGVHADKWLIPAMKKVEIVIVLKISKPILYKRVLTRYLLNKKKHYDNIRSLFKMLNWAHIYNKNNYVSHINLINLHKVKAAHLKNKKEIGAFISSLKPA